MRIDDVKVTILSGLTLSLCIMSFLVIAGCTAPQQQTGTPAITQSVPAAVIETFPPTTISTSMPTPVPIFPPDIRPVRLAYQFKDNYGKQIVSINVKNYAVQNQYTYFYDDAYTPNEIVALARQGYKFLIVGVTWDLVGIVGPGSRTSFITPNTTSYKLISQGDMYEPLYPFTLANPMHYYIKNQGTLVMSESIDKDNPGSGVLVFEVPGDVAAKDSYIEFCPQNEPYFIYQPHTPDNWDCTSNTIRWRLV
jgi:hypothetical protein